MIKQSDDYLDGAYSSGVIDPAKARGLARVQYANLLAAKDLLSKDQIFALLGNIYDQVGAKEFCKLVLAEKSEKTRS